MNRTVIAILAIAVFGILLFSGGDEDDKAVALEVEASDLTVEVVEPPAVEDLPRPLNHDAGPPAGYARIDGLLATDVAAAAPGPGLAELLDYELEIAHSLPGRRERVEWMGAAVLPLAIHALRAAEGTSAQTDPGASGDEQEPWLFLCQGTWHVVALGEYPLFDEYAQAAAQSRGALDDYVDLSPDFVERSERFAFGVLERLREARVAPADRATEHARGQ